MFRVSLIFLAGGCGCLLRYGIAGWAQRLGNGSFPVGTLVVNVLGCVAIGFLASLFTGPILIREEYRLAILVGLLGGFTTFSTFGYETITLTDGGVRISSPLRPGSALRVSRMDSPNPPSRWWTNPGTSSGFASKPMRQALSCHSAVPPHSG